MVGNGKVRTRILNEVLITARHDCVEVFFLNHTTFSVKLESLPFYPFRHDGRATPLPELFLWYLPRQASDICTFFLLSTPK